jgi:hypothetical protein
MQGYENIKLQKKTFLNKLHFPFSLFKIVETKNIIKENRRTFFPFTIPL